MDQERASPNLFAGPHVDRQAEAREAADWRAAAAADSATLYVASQGTAQLVRMEPAPRIAFLRGDHPLVRAAGEQQFVLLGWFREKRCLLVELDGTGSDVLPAGAQFEELRGIAGLRGAALPVYDLSALLGYPSASAARWLVVARGASVAFAFEAFDGQLRIDLTAVVSHDGGTSREHVREAARTADLIRPIVNLPSVLAAIGQRMPAAGQQREQKR